MKIQIILIAMILAITGVTKVTRAEETNCPECLAKRVLALEASQAEMQKTLNTILDRLDQIPPAPPVEPPIEQVACSELSATQRATINQVCVTSKGVKFRRVARANFGEAWADEEGQIWSDRIRNANQYDAIKYCKAIEGKLPSKDDFIRGEANGIREVLPNMKARWFWSSSVHPKYSYFAYFFSGYNGFIDYYYRSNNSSSSVRCVASR